MDPEGPDGRNDKWRMAAGEGAERAHLSLTHKQRDGQGNGMNPAAPSDVLPPARFHLLEVP